MNQASISRRYGPFDTTKWYFWYCFASSYMCQDFGAHPATMYEYVLFWSLEVQWGPIWRTNILDLDPRKSCFNCKVGWCYEIFYLVMITEIVDHLDCPQKSPWVHCRCMHCPIMANQEMTRWKGLGVVLISWAFGLSRWLIVLMIEFVMCVLPWTSYSLLFI
jgi:hypothetical protein